MREFSNLKSKSTRVFLEMRELRKAMHSKYKQGDGALLLKIHNLHTAISEISKAFYCLVPIDRSKALRRLSDPSNIEIEVLGEDAVKFNFIFKKYIQPIREWGGSSDFDINLESFENLVQKMSVLLSYQEFLRSEQENMSATIETVTSDPDRRTNFNFIRRLDYFLSACINIINSVQTALPSLINALEQQLQKHPPPLDCRPNVQPHAPTF